MGDGGGPSSAAARTTDGRDLLLAARRGDAEAGRALVAAHGASMLRSAWRVLGRYGGRDAEDVVQEALLAALTTGALPSGDVGAWLRAITVRKAIDATRRTGSRREEPIETALAAGGGEPESAAGGPAAALDVLTVRHALARLSAADRAVLELVELEGLSAAEAGVVLGITRLAVRLRVMRARRRLARLIGPRGSIGEA